MTPPDKADKPLMREKQRALADEAREWWNNDGSFYDPDTADVPLIDKLPHIAQYAYLRGRALAHPALEGEVAEAYERVKSGLHHRVAMADEYADSQRGWSGNTCRQHEAAEQAKVDALLADLEIILRAATSTPQASDGGLEFMLAKEQDLNAKLMKKLEDAHARIQVYVGATSKPQATPENVAGEVSRLGLALFALRDLRSCCNLPSDNDFKKSCMKKADDVLAMQAATSQQPDTKAVEGLVEAWAAHLEKEGKCIAADVVATGMREALAKFKEGGGA